MTKENCVARSRAVRRGRLKRDEDRTNQRLQLDLDMLAGTLRGEREKEGVRSCDLVHPSTIITWYFVSRGILGHVTINHVLLDHVHFQILVRKMKY